MKLELDLIALNLYSILISFPRLEFCKRKNAKVFPLIEGLFYPNTYVSVYCIVGGVTCVNGITYVPVLKLFQGLEPNEHQTFEEAEVFHRKFQSESLQL